MNNESDPNAPESSCETAKSSLAEQVAEVLKLLGHPARVRMLLQLVEQDRTVAWLAEDNEISPHAASGHLRLMQRSGVVKGIRRGKFVFYRIADENIKRLMHSLANWKVG